MADRPRVLIWTESYWVGGSDRFVLDIVEGLADHAEVRLAGNPLPALDALLARRVPWVLPRITVPVANLVNSPLARMRGRFAPARPELADDLPERPSATPAAIAGAALRYRAACVNHLRLTRLLRRLRPDVLLVNNGGYPGGESCRIIVPAARSAGVPRVVQFVHNMAYPPWWPAAGELRLDQRVDAATDLWLTAAERARAALAERRGIPAEHIRTVYYGIHEPPGPRPEFDPAALRADIGFMPGTPGILVVAAFERRKGHAVLVEALRRVASPVRVALAGSGPDESAVRELVTMHGLADRVRFLGWRDDVDDLMRVADLFVMPSLANECLPYAILEAMAHGLPVIGTDVAGIPEEIQHGVTGEVVAPGDAGALAAAIVRLAGDADRARAMGEAGRERQVRYFSRERMVALVLAALRPSA
jgi:glycosyltransferase involved in cell wall biosynthesis